MNRDSGVVVGSQSSGKSSVLESLVGKDFLPRGIGIVTRRPLYLQLRNVAHGHDWAEFSHKKGEVYKDFDLVRREIEIETERVAGINKGISKDPICLKVFSKDVVDLTLVDLPGITKVPIGDQPPDIEEQIMHLVRDYVESPSCIILSVTAANTDLANSDSLKLAREVDPRGERTIGVVTKIDLMDEGTDALDLLQGKIYPLKLGYTGVVCRSQKDILNKKPIAEALRAEKEFFMSHPIYAPMYQQLGVPFLSRSLNTVLVSHIKRTLPSLRAKIASMVQVKEKELESYGADYADCGEGGQGALILNLLGKYSHSYSELIDGRFVKDSATEYLGGSRIRYIFQDIFGQTVLSIDPFDQLGEEDIKTAIRNACGLRPSLFVPEEAFEVLVK